MTKLRCVALIAVAAPLLALACGDDDASQPEASPGTAQPPATSGADGLTEDDAAYLDEIRAIDSQITERVQAVDEALSSTYETEGRLFSVVGEHELHTTFDEMLAEADALTPPDRFADDHQAYVMMLENSVELAEQLEAAMQTDDIVRFALISTELLLSRTGLLLDASPAFCAESLNADLPPNCAPSEPVPGGDYGEQLNGIFREFAAEFAPRVGSFLPAFSPDDRIAALLELQPPIVSTLEATLDDVQTLEPPDDLRDDHETIVQYLEQTLDVSRAITAAAEEGDFDETEVQFRRSGTVICSAQNALSDKALAIVPFWFNLPGC